MRDLYSVLGVKRSATTAEIQKAYRRKAKACHPDSGGSAEAFGELATAYAVLSDADRRERYDRTGKIELPQPDNRDGSAVEIIAQKLGLIIHAEQDMTAMDLDSLIDQAIRADIEERQTTITGLKRALARVARLKERVKCRRDGAANTVARVLDWHELSTKSNIKKHEQAVISMERALKILEDYSFTDDLSFVAENLATADKVSAALHDALQALDELAVVLNATHSGAKATA